MTAAERLKQLSGLAGVTAAAMLLTIGTGATAGDLLVSKSGLQTGTAAQHLLAERSVSVPVAGGSGGIDNRIPVHRTHNPYAYKQAETTNQDAISAEIPQKVDTRHETPAIKEELAKVNALLSNANKGIKQLVSEAWKEKVKRDEAKRVAIAEAIAKIEADAAITNARRKKDDEELMIFVLSIEADEEIQA